MESYDDELNFETNSHLYDPGAPEGEDFRKGVREMDDILDELGGLSSADII